MESVRPLAEEPRFEPGATIANYVIEELLGQGSEGSVFVARDTLLGRKVAMKTLRAAELGETRGVEEARLLATLEHPNIVRVYHARRHQGVWYVVYEYLRGGSVQSLIDRLGPLPVEQALDFAAQAAAGLSFAHRQGILHRDIKPQNLLLTGRGELKLADFGLAFDARGERRAQSLVGTPAFLAPEVWQGEPATAASDVFSLGACLFLLLSGRLPFVGTSKEQLQQAQAELSPKLPPGLPPPVAELLSQMFAKAPAARPDSQTLPRALQQLAAAPYAYAAPTRTRQEGLARVKSPFSAGGPERALREALRSGRDVAYVSELSSLLSRAARGVEICAATPADGLLLLDVAREVGAEKRPIAARLTLAKPRGTLADTIERQLARSAGASLQDACADLLQPTRLLGTGALIVLHAPRGLSAEQRAEVATLAEQAVAAGGACVVTIPLPESEDAEAPLPGFARMLAFGVAEPARELEERLKLWIRFATDDQFRFSTDALRLAAHYCRSEGRFWANLALQSLLIASAAQLPIVTSWAVAGARAQAAPWHDPSEVPAAWRKRPLSWPSPSMASELARLRAQAALVAPPLLSEPALDSLAV
jgi:tRNA A-37 threonylcarbamoyl transferase component Bud32